ncbi:MAG: serine hydrolase [Chitinophagaceae bacterium]|jgi:CubicO group peptidase (beta-lactamase class C family)|nr:serine hydrolase [Chitinophagaceae bacterium]
MKLKLLTACIVLFAFHSTAQQPAFITDSLERYIERGMKEWNIPGLSIAIVKDGKTIFMKGYGVKEVGKPEKVDENTLFIIASNSKLFTGTSLSNLDYEKKLSLEDKVTKYIPWFRLYDSTSTALATVRDMLCHRLGTKTFQGDFTFWNSNLSKDSIIYKMRFLKPSGQFRQDYGYCNSGFLVAGEILQKVTGITWEQYVSENILQPVGMTNTYMNTAGMGKRNNVAAPYSNSFGKLSKLPYDEIDNLGPATSMVSCVSDLSKWLKFQLDSGKADGKQILPWQVLQRTRDGNILTGSRKSPYYPTHFRAYGLGEYMTDYNGRQVYWHTGGAFGFVTNVCFVPEEKLGITILTNNDNQNFFEALRYQILDAYLGVKYTDRSAFMQQFQAQDNALNESLWKKWDDRVNKKPALPVPADAFVGTYFNHVYGNMQIVKENNQLKVLLSHHPNITGKLEYIDNKNFLLTWSHPGYGKFAVPFELDNGKVKAIEIKAADFVEYDGYVFLKKN